MKLVKIKINYSSAVELYSYDGALSLNINDMCIIDTRYGHDVGRIMSHSILLEEKKNVTPEYQVLRLATKEDLKQLELCSDEANKAFEVAKEKINSHQLPMKLISVHFFLDRNKILFTFTADGRVDFRELVRDLAATYKTRIELKQIGVRDEAVLLGGYGVCGREFCCCKQSRSYDPISIKMAKEQNLTLSSVKISGVCGRLMCCLDYELEQYQNVDMSCISDCREEPQQCEACPKKIIISPEDKNESDAVPQGKTNYKPS